MKRRLPRIPPYHERVAAAARWQTALAILSLDAALPLWQPMGLSLTPEQTARVNAAAKAAYADMLQGQWNPYAADYSRAPTIVETFIGTVERENRVEARTSIEAWAQRTFKDSPREHQAQARDPELALPTDLLAIVLPAIRALREPSYVVPTRRDVQSDWDRQILFGYPDDSDCMSSVSLLLRRSATDRMLTQLRRDLSPQQYDLFIAWCASHPYSSWNGNRPNR
ncbi:MAG TPA: hypothetical protein VFG64_00710 [Dongiaceae bacterium]|jgi:hypothetical protein|nr:hypothetical protein [Dongiaceae bacterium]